jgi:hypothetical protein
MFERDWRSVGYSFGEGNISNGVISSDNLVCCYPCYSKIYTVYHYPKLSHNKKSSTLYITSVLVAEDTSAEEVSRYELASSKESLISFQHKLDR